VPPVCAVAIDQAKGCTCEGTRDPSYQFAISQAAGVERNEVMGDVGLRYTW